MNWTAPLHKFYDENRTFLVFVFRFVLSFILMRAAYEIYLHYTAKVGSLDMVTYGVSYSTHTVARWFGVANCEFSCFMDGCAVGVPGNGVNIIEGCNGLNLAIVYAAYIFGVDGATWRAFAHMVFGFFVIQAFNVARIAALIVLLEQGGNFYFFFIKNIFFTIIYGAIVVLWLLKPWIDRWLFFQKKSDAQRA
jgi:exosortase family protein XrtF